MADSHKVAHTWTYPPAGELRRLKTMVEDEMMIKLGAKKETIEFHPLILAQRAERPKTSFELDYQRVKPPYQEKLPPNRNPWVVTDNALRQMSNLSRQGPRKLQLPSVSHTKAVKRVYIPEEDEEFKRLRLFRLMKRDEILAEWSALQQQAFTARKLSRLTLPDIEPLRKYSSASLFSLKSLSLSNKGVVEGQRKVKKTVVPFTYVPPTGKPKSRWRGMARQLLWNTKSAQMRLADEFPRSEIKIYFSCTQDLSEEREFLAEVAYPELRKFCEKQGLSCHVVDLRNGTNRLKNDRETFDVIHREITKCQRYSIGPCFVSMVGGEADDNELPGWLSTEDMLTIRSVLVKAENVVAVEALDNLYRLDSNYQPPIYLLEDHFFFAETEETAILHSVLPEVLTQLQQEGKLAEQPNFYSWSSTVKEIETGLLTCVEPRRQTVCLMARAGDCGGSINEEAAGDNKRKRSVLSDGKVPAEYTAKTGDAGADKLRGAIVERYNRLGSKENLILFNASKKKSMAYLREVCTLFMSAITRVIDRQIAHHEFDISHHMTSAADVVQHVTVARHCCSSHVGGENALSHVSELLKNPNYIKPIVVTGPEGAGKTSLTSLIAAALPRIDPLRKVVCRILGLTLSSSSLFHLMASLYSQVSFIYDTDPWLPDDLTPNGALQIFRDLLYDIREKTLQKGPLTIVLDGLDKVQGMTPKHLSFLIGSMPQGITLVMSVLNEGPLFETVKTVTGIEIVSCPTFIPDWSISYVKTYLEKQNRVLTNDQLRAILGELSEECVPLVAKISASMASRWPSHTLNDDLDISKDMESAFHRLVESCEVLLGYRFTRYVLSLLVASRFGLADFEILHILATDTTLIDEIKEEEAEDLSVLEGYPYQMQLSRLLSRMDPFLYEVKTEGETILKIHHEMLRYVVQERFMTDSFKNHIHARLATFFLYTRRGNLLSSRDIVEGKHKDLSRYLWRTLRSVPYHLCHSHPEPEEAWKELKSAVFMKFSWIINEIYAGFFNDFIDDLNYALDTLGLESDIMFLRQFMSGVREAIIFNPVSLASLMAGQDMKEMEEIQKSVQEAQEWLKQVHLQVLVPTSYTTPKTSQLQLKETVAKKVRSIVATPTEDRMILQYDTNISSMDYSTGEEVGLVSLSGSVVSTHLWGQTMITVVTKVANSQRLTLDTYAVDKGRHVKTTTLQDKSISWLYVRPDGIVFYASGISVKKVVVEKGQVSEQFTAEEEIVDACLTNRRPYKLVALHTSPKPHLSVFDSRQPGGRRTISLLKVVITERCKPLNMTKDMLYVVLVCDRQVVVVDLSMERVVHTLDFNNVPVSLTAFSRSHEHVFVVNVTGVIRCFKLDSGKKVMETSIQKKQKPQQLTVPTSPRGRNSVSPGRSRTSPRLVSKREKQSQKKEEESITTVVTSEDDHFLLAGTTQGRVYMVHVPTGEQVCVISSGQASLKDIVYFTNLTWFQSMVTVDVSGWAKLWNLRPLVTRSRGLIMDIITDKDLLNEEEAKMDLALYCKHFQERRNDRMFLNGPDVSSFYRKELPPDLFSSVHTLDPALQTPVSWMSTGCLGDCTFVQALSAGTSLSEVLVTVTREGDLARWSLQDGSLLSLQPSPTSLTEGEEQKEDGEEEKEAVVVESVRTVYYDQAIFVVVRPPGSKRGTVAVQYAEDKTTRPLVLNDVIASYVSTTTSSIVHVMSGEQGELTLVYWNLVKGIEQNRLVLSKEQNLTKLATTVTFSNDLSVCALLVPQGKDDSTLYVWTLTINSEPETSATKDKVNDKDNDDKDDEVFSRSGRPSDKEHEAASRRTGKRTKEFHFRELELQIHPTAIGFALNDAILLGTSSGVTLIVAMETWNLTSAMTSEGIEPVANQPLSIAGTWARFAAPHKGAVREVRCAADKHVVTTSCGRVLCVWHLLSKRLMVRVPLDGDEEFVHYVLSYDCRVLTYVTSGGVIAVWGVQEKKQLCAFRQQVAVVSLAMTPDSRRVAVLLDDEVTSRVQVFDVRNIDDIRVDSGSQSLEERDSIASRNTSIDEDF